MIAAFECLALAAGLGMAAAWMLARPAQGGGSRLGPLLPAILHGLAGSAGLFLLWRGLAEPPRGAEIGVDQFGHIAFWLIAGAFIIALAMLGTRIAGRRPPVLLAGLHATLAIGGVLLLAAYVMLPG